MTVEDSLCKRIVTAIGKVCPPGVYAWPRAWEMVEGPSQRCLALLPRYTKGGDGIRIEFEHAANDVVRAWKRAVKEWEAAGRPTG